MAQSGNIISGLDPVKLIPKDRQGYQNKDQSAGD
jgi:hypothetical protein